MPTLRKLLLLIGVPLAAIVLFEFVFPRNETSARERLEAHGYSNVRVSETRRYCGRNRQVFRFEAHNDSGVPVSGQLCFDLIRPFSSITEDPTP